jgi:cytoskeletal protein CcmA (bactofilin family)
MFGKRDEGLPLSMDKVDTIIGKGTEFSGTIKASGLLRIEGKVEGEIESSGDVVLAEGSEVNAELKARHSVIAGTYSGNISLEGKLEIRATGKVRGDVRVAGLVIEDGAHFDGKCEMDLNRGQEKNLKLIKSDQKLVN